MKKLTSLILVLLCLAGCGSGTMTFDIREADRIDIQSGLTGETASVKDSGTIRDLTQEINALAFQNTSRPSGNGYAYVLTWFDTDGVKTAEITITTEDGRQISYNGSDYTVEEGRSIDTERIEELLSSAQ